MLDRNYSVFLLIVLFCNLLVLYYTTDSLDAEFRSVQRDQFQLKSNLKKENGWWRMDIVPSNKTAKTINVVLIIRPGAIIPTVLSLHSDQLNLQTINYIMTNYTFTRNQEEITALSSVANITITNFIDDNDYLAVSMGLYYKSDYVIIAAIEKGTNHLDVEIELSDWIVKGVNNLDKQSTNHFVAGSMTTASDGTFLTNFLCISNVYLRQLLMYSDITFDHSTLFNLLPVLASRNSSYLYSHLPDLKPETIKLQDGSLLYPTFQKCQAFNKTVEKKYDVFIRLYKRNYIRDQLDRLFNQTLAPSRVFILQNRNLVDFEFDSLVQAYKQRDIYYIWNVNWNSFFHLSYLLSSFSSSPFSITYDDDQLLLDLSMHANIINTLMQQPGIYSLRPWCWCKHYRNQTKVDTCLKSCASKTDLVVNPFFTYSSMSKYMWRYDIPMYYCCEEMSLLLTSSIECNIQWYSLDYSYESKQVDHMDRSTDPYTQKLKETVDWKNIEHEAMSYYVRAGYKVPSTYDSVYKEMKRETFPIL